MDEQLLLKDEKSVVAALKVGAALGNVKTLSDGRQVLVTPDGYQHDVFEPDYIKPPRKKIVVALHDAASFCQYVNDFGSKGDSQIFADVLKTSFKAVLDYHGTGADGEARHCEHIASYACRLTPEWVVWTENSGKGKTQQQFAEWVENNQPDIVDPPGGQVLEVVRTLEARKDVRFASSIRLDNGQQQLTYEEDIKGTAAKGTLQIPEKFALGIAPFQGGTAYRLEARLRYRIKEGALTLWYDLLRPQKVLEAAFQDTVEVIADKCSIAILQGSV